MAYGIKYRLTQALRDGTNLYVDIYERDYTIDLVINYDAVNIQLNSNASEDEPLAAIISSQLNISFLVSDENYDDFPELLSFDDRKYYVKLLNEDTLLWCGFLFNDYVQVPFTTGYIQVDMIAIDGLSFLEYSTFDFVESQTVNSLFKHIDIIAEILNEIQYPEAIDLITSCSYYAEGMNDRADSLLSEPFNQTYQYRRDIQGVTYYQVLEYIVKSFGCRLFQSDGKWQILAINEMANDTRYFTRYEIYPTAVAISGGIFNKDVTINPYANGNVHFVNNSQTKIVRKGYPKLKLTYDFNYPNNYIHNGTFKGLQNYTPTPDSLSVFGWFLYYSTGTYPTNLIEVVPDSNFNNINLLTSVTAGATSYFQNRPPAPLTETLYAPYMVGPQFTLSLEHIMLPSTVGKVEIRLVRGATSYYYNSANTWQTTQTYLTIDNPFTPDTYRDEFNSYSISVNMTYPAIPVGVGLQWGGYVLIKIFVQQGTDHNAILFRNVKLTQGSFITNSIEVTREIGTGNNNIKELKQDYGSYAEFTYTLGLLTNNLGVLYNADANVLKNWYRYPNTESFPLLQMLIARQYSNLLSKNFGTLEGDLGSFKTTEGLNYLDKVYLVTDPITTPLTYDGKKFLLNRASIVPQIDEVDSMQIIEITDVDNESTETIQYIDS